MKKKGCDIKIIVAAHMAYRMPDDTLYLPLHVGAEGKKDLGPGYQKDNTGEHISGKNFCFCELTGLYWVWKNLNYDYLGLVHYRRYFSVRKKGRHPFSSVLTKKEAEILLRKHSILVPKKRNYYIETLYSHYAHTHYAEHLDEMRKILCEKYPEYVKAYDRVLDQTSGYMFNMMVMRKDYIDAYCQWLFDVLFELERRIDMEYLSDFQKRFCGRVGEILFNVWLTYMQDQGKIRKGEILEIPCIHMEKIDWMKKIRAFLMAKMFHKKYESSFK